ncbi:FGGY-family carbohydrate kinase [Lentilitoribacter sp. Alg239-R112]|uniref:FGGY-family carbohydrate kinase n=1 Tax=Lentilitoribacter sp. Alg239-R112 TaxID=2305987 RepID=UPI0013A70090|nr:FGGY-family carbohydrate kinase [Lentilitoribacter sp. Alg239-R112]
MAYFLGIDVGTGSARAGLFDEAGRLLAAASRDTKTFNPKPDYMQQSSADIWQAICASVREVISDANVTGADIAGIGFDATCSLVVCTPDGGPVSVAPGGEPEQDVILWMDHRAIKDAEMINDTGAEVLKYVGDVISPEMEIPKLRWLKNNLPQTWDLAGHFFDLPDWLVWRATGTKTRSLCSSVCKWTYMGHKGLNGEGWDSQFLSSVGLEDLTHETYAKIGNRFASPGDNVGQLSQEAADELGLSAGMPVAASLIDAYSGALGTLGAMPDLAPLTQRMAIIAGTSACHIALSQEPVFVQGVWGPYYSVLLPNVWALEGGQSAAGALIDTIIEQHSAGSEMREQARSESISIYEKLSQTLDAMGSETAFLTRDRHVQPDFHGNRSPLADPNRLGAISGLSLAHGGGDLALNYLATLQALAYGSRHILEEMVSRGVPVTALVLSGGLAHNTLFLRELADACQIPVIVPEQSEPVLLGSAMLGAVAAGAMPDLATAMEKMSGPGRSISPRTGQVSQYHDRKYQVFRRMQDDFAAYTTIMHEEEE